MLKTLEEYCKKCVDSDQIEKCYFDGDHIVCLYLASGHVIDNLVHYSCNCPKSDSVDDIVISFSINDHSEKVNGVRVSKSYTDVNVVDISACRQYDESY